MAQTFANKIFYDWKQSFLWFWLWGTIKKWKEEDNLTNESLNDDSGYRAAPGFSLV